MKIFSALIVLSVSAVTMVVPAAGGYRLLQTIPVAGDDGWDHPTVDSAARRLYVTHGWERSTIRRELTLPSLIRNLIVALSATAEPPD